MSAATSGWEAPAGEENLRIIRGNVDGNGTIDAGVGFSVQRIAEGSYLIIFVPGFSGTPSVTVTPMMPPASEGRGALVVGPTPNQVNVGCRFWSGGNTDSDFSFYAIGPR
jgi:hypothetical protein